MNVITKLTPSLSQVVPEFPEVSDPNHPDLLFGPKEQQLELLAKVACLFPGPASVLSAVSAL